MPSNRGNKTSAERQYQRHIIDNFLINKHGFIETNCKKDYNVKYALDKTTLFNFLENSSKQNKESLKYLKTTFDDYQDEIMKEIDKEIRNVGIVEFLRKDFTIKNRKLQFYFSKPNHNLNPETLKDFKTNIWSVMEEIEYDGRKSTDLGIFINGFPIMLIELKCNFSNQTVNDAIEQWQNRNENEKIFRERTMVFFAIDSNEIAMTNKLKSYQTSFLPFNKKWNQPNAEFFWDSFIDKSNLAKILDDYVFAEKNKDGSYTMIFPRFHQWDCVEKIEKDILNKTQHHHYLCVHSAGSGKTKTMCWLARNLSYLNKNNKPVFNYVIIVTDRNVVDRQLGNALDQLAGSLNKDGDKIKFKHVFSADELSNALKFNTPVIVSTIQKFSYIENVLKKHSDLNFAIIIDEAHSSTGGQYQENINNSLSTKEKEFNDLAFSEKDFQASLNTKNITFFAFTASPKDKTIEMFGIDKPDGGKKEFHEYTTEQAISEGVILDITKNIYVKKSLPLIIKKINDDPLLNTLPTKRKIEAIIDNDEKSIEPQTTIDLKMFFDKTYNLLDRNGKAMIVCSSIENAILRYNEIIKQLKRDYGNKICKVLIAFSGSKKIDNKEYTEDSINNIKSSIEDEFDKQDYKILVCANKFQTGFDQKKLCSLFIHKKMKGVNLYQTFQRINRKYEMVSSNAQIIIKKQSDDLLVLDWKNNFDVIKKALNLYYTSPYLKTEFDEKILVDKYKDVINFNFFDLIDLDNFVIKYANQNHFYSKTVTEICVLAFELKKYITKFLTLENIEVKKKLKYACSIFYQKYMYANNIKKMNENDEQYKMFIFLKFFLKSLTWESVNTPIIDVMDIKNAIYIDEVKHVDIVGVVKCDGVKKDVSKSNELKEGNKNFKPLQQIIIEIMEKYWSSVKPVEQKNLIDKLSEILEKYNNDIETKDIARTVNYDKFHEWISDKIHKDIVREDINQLSDNSGALDELINKFADQLYKKEKT